MFLDWLLRPWRSGPPPLPDGSERDFDDYREYYAVSRGLQPGRLRPQDVAACRLCRRLLQGGLCMFGLLLALILAAGGLPVPLAETWGECRLAPLGGTSPSFRISCAVHFLMNLAVFGLFLSLLAIVPGLLIHSSRCADARALWEREEAALAAEKIARLKARQAAEGDATPETPAREAETKPAPSAAAKRALAEERAARRAGEEDG